MLTNSVLFYLFCSAKATKVEAGVRRHASKHLQEFKSNQDRRAAEVRYRNTRKNRWSGKYCLILRLGTEWAVELSYTTS